LWLLAAVLAALLAVSFSTTLRKRAPAAADAKISSPLPIDASAERIEFEAAAKLAPAGTQKLSGIAETARSSGAAIVITPFFDAKEDAALANERALVVRHALEADGVAPQRLVVKPAAAAGDGSAARIEVALQ
jgi:type IV pilus biogenesis protein CpaD/CtpE